MDAAPLISPNRAIRMLKLELVIDVGVRAFALIVFPIIQAREVEARIDHRNETAALAPAELERSWNDRTVLFAEIDGAASADFAVGCFHVDSSRRFPGRCRNPQSFSRSQSTVRSTASRIPSRGCHPSDWIRSVFRKINGLSPTHPRSPPE